MLTQREELLPLLEALDASPKALRRDDNGNFEIVGSRGNAYPWGDGKTWWVFVSARSAKHWTFLKRRLVLAGMEITQDGDDEGAGRLTTPITPEQAAVIREACGIHQRKRYSAEDLARFAQNLPMKAT
jgi:hypothetical protein